MERSWEMLEKISQNDPGLPSFNAGNANDHRGDDGSIFGTFPRRSKQKFENRLKFDHCESLLSDLEFMNKPSSTPKVSKKETKKVAGMETIKRQMDSLTEMVNDLQVVLVSDWLTF